MEQSEKRCPTLSPPQAKVYTTPSLLLGKRNIKWHADTLIDKLAAKDELVSPVSLDVVGFWSRRNVSKPIITVRPGKGGSTAPDDGVDKGNRDAAERSSGVRDYEPRDWGAGHLSADFPWDRHCHDYQ